MSDDMGRQRWIATSHQLFICPASIHCSPLECAFYNVHVSFGQYWDWMTDQDGMGSNDYSTAFGNESLPA